MNSFALRVTALVISLSSGVTPVSATVLKTKTADPTPTEPCVIARDAYMAQISESPDATPTIAASKAYACLTSVPLHTEAAIRLLDELEPFLEWQSDLAFLENPPSDWPHSPVDIFGEVEEIRLRLERGRYLYELGWQQDLYRRVVGKAHNGHLAYFPDLLTVPFEFARPWTFVSVSEDGTSLPVIKVLEDVVSPTEKSSHVVKINDIDAAAFIQNRVADAANCQDLDAGYNAMFFSTANKAGLDSTGYFEAGGRERFVYPGNSTRLTFANGTTVEKRNIARFHSDLGDWHKVVDGATMHKEFCRGAYDTESSHTHARDMISTASDKITSLPQSRDSLIARKTPPGKIDGYPEPVLMTDDQYVSGYFIDEPGFEEVAVLVLLSFDSADFVAFQSAVQGFFTRAVEAGKTKLILDLQANGGGKIYQGYDTFRQIFPDIIQDGPSRWRSTTTFNAVSTVYSSICADYTPRAGHQQELDGLCNTSHNWRSDLNNTNEPFTSYADKFGPVASRGDHYTNEMQYDPANPVYTHLPFGTDVTGYGNRTDFTRPFGGPENIVLLYDGYCASTCALFSKFMRHDAGVKSIAMGGRPREGLVQGVGGAKGAQVYELGFLGTLAKEALQRTNNKTLKEELRQLDDRYVSSRSPLLPGSINVRDSILSDDSDADVPAQFVTELADCRLYWTTPMISNAEEIWKAAAKAAFKGGKCAAGGIEQPAQRPYINSLRLSEYRKHPLPVRDGDLPSSDSLIGQYLRLKVSD
ncbi:hypothetical protein GGS20DRAFT_576507 [Poronia punctata]|nr:hypothetical protein GGS20DRAFT_576507 [Poronia punctata]